MYFSATGVATVASFAKTSIAIANTTRPLNSRRYGHSPEIIDQSGL